MIAERRRYALIKLNAGDYLLPGNDDHTIWRLRQYTDGPSAGLDWPRDRKVWELLRWIGPGQPETEDDLFAFSGLWEQATSTLDTRREAIEIAMSAEGGTR